MVIPIIGINSSRSIPYMMKSKITFLPYIRVWSWSPKKHSAAVIVCGIWAYNITAEIMRLLAMCLSYQSKNLVMGVAIGMIETLKYLRVSTNHRYGHSGF